MLRAVLLTTAALFALSTPAVQAATHHDAIQAKGPPGGDYKKVSSLVPLPDFVPGLGILYVQPKTLPVGPFLAYDKQDKLVSTVYMVTLDDLQAHKEFDDLAVAQHKVDHVDLYYNAGHPGVEKPHYHVVLWYIPEAEAERLKVAGK